MNLIFNTKKEEEFKNLIWEIESEEVVLGFGLETILPPRKIYSRYKEEKDASGIKIIRDYFEDNYNELLYKKKTKLVEKMWASVSYDFSEALKKIGLDTDGLTYKAQITLFGPGGSYLPPDKIIIRVVNKDDMSRAVTNIAHELVHLLIEKEIIEKYGINQKEKEDIVNSLFGEIDFKKIFPDYIQPSYYKKPKKTLVDYLNEDN